MSNNSPTNNSPTDHSWPVKVLSTLMLLVCALLAGCTPSATGVSPTPAGSNLPTAAGTLDPTGAAERGRTVFNGVGQCATCHTIDGRDRATGPGLKGIAALVAERYPDREIVAFLHESIVAPDAVIFEGWPAGLMPKNYAAILTTQQIDDLVAYMRTLN